jgi:UDP-glucose 4-epimerase
LIIVRITMLEKKVLVIGGAGYIGSHTCFALTQAGYQVVVLDNLCKGKRKSVLGLELHELDIRDAKNLSIFMQSMAPQLGGIIHFAALAEVGESAIDPASYYDVNVTGSLNVLREAVKWDLPLVFSSTCATFGIPQSPSLNEEHPQRPINPYGRTKLVVEMMIGDLVQANGLKAATMRYFNAAGAANEAGIGEDHDPETHAIPLILKSIAEGNTFRIFGDDYETRDGTCIRDYIHVLDLAGAHIKALEYLLGGGPSTSFNLGTGSGTSVKELVDAISLVTGKHVKVEVAGRRIGDPPVLVADSSKAREILGWSAQKGLADILKSAAIWHGIIQPATTAR